MWATWLCSEVRMPSPVPPQLPQPAHPLPIMPSWRCHLPPLEIGTMKTSLSLSPPSLAGLSSYPCFVHLSSVTVNVDHHLSESWKTTLLFDTLPQNHKRTGHLWLISVFCNCTTCLSVLHLRNSFFFFLQRSSNHLLFYFKGIPRFLLILIMPFLGKICVVF